MIANRAKHDTLFPYHFQMRPKTITKALAMLLDTPAAPVEILNDVLGMNWLETTMKSLQGNSKPAQSNQCRSQSGLYGCL